MGFAMSGKEALQLMLKAFTYFHIHVNYTNFFKNKTLTRSKFQFRNNCVQNPVVIGCFRAIMATRTLYAVPNKLNCSSLIKQTFWKFDFSLNIT